MLSSLQSVQHASPAIAPHLPPLRKDHRRTAAIRAAGAAATPATDDYVQLGQSPLHVSSVGVGTLSWGDPNKVSPTNGACTSCAPRGTCTSLERAVTRRSDASACHRGRYRRVVGLALALWRCLSAFAQVDKVGSSSPRARVLLSSRTALAVKHVRRPGAAIVSFSCRQACQPRLPNASLSQPRTRARLQGWAKRFQESDLTDICAVAREAGINYYDTAEVYGYQGAAADNSSECLIRRHAMTQAPEGRPVVVGSKYFTIPWTNALLGGGFRFGSQSMADALEATLKRLGTESVDLYQVHFPFPTYPQQVRIACRSVMPGF